MKKCPYCGKEYPDDIVRCSTDNVLLEGGEPPPLLPPVLASVSVTAPPPPRIVTDRRMRLIELLLVCIIAFGAAILESFRFFFGYSPATLGSGEFRWIYGILREASCLGLLWYVLRRSGRSFRDLGFAWAGSDIGWSFLLRIAASLAFYGVYYSIFFAERIHIISPTQNVNAAYFLFGSHVALTALLFQFINPFFEELIVRAYVMTEVKRLTNSVGKAIFVSTALQTSYHFYQGVPAALGHAAEFLIFSIYYAKTNRITPVILAHLYDDVGFTLFYELFH